MSTRGSGIGPSPLQRLHHGRSYVRRRAVIGALILVPMALLAMYFLLPLLWLLVSTTKSTGQLFNMPMFSPAPLSGVVANLKDLGQKEGGAYWRWYLNSIVYSTLTAGVGTLISALAGYALAKYTFKLQGAVSFMILVALLLPSAALTIPVFLLIKGLGLMDTYVAVILPLLASPFGVYFMSVYIRETMPNELIDSGRIDGANDYQIFRRIAAPILGPGLVTLFLVSFISSWNNFFLPLLVLSSSKLFPVTLGLQMWVSKLINPATGIPPYPLIVLGSTLSVLPMVVLFPFLRKHIAAGIATGSIKA
jgi:multiple sugar transport system permease protein